MPCEIKELVVRAVVTDPGDDPKPPVPPIPVVPRRVSCEEQEQIIEACVQQVLKILKRSNDR